MIDTFYDRHSSQAKLLGGQAVLHLICGVRVGTRRLEPPQGASGKRGLLGASEWPTFFPRSSENGHTSPRSLKSLPRGPESLFRALRGLWERGFQDPEFQDHGKGPLFCLSYVMKDKETTVAVLTVLAVSAVMAVSVMTATPLKLNPPCP